MVSHEIRLVLEKTRQLIRIRHYSIRTEHTYLKWIRDYIKFHNWRHPASLGKKEITAFLTHLAVDKNVAASTQNQALAALLFLYRFVLEQPFGWLDDVERAKRPERIPVVLTRSEVKAILSQLEGTNWIMSNLLYGSGLRLMECLRLRVKDIDFHYNQIIVRDTKGRKDRVTMIPRSLKPHLK